MTSTPSRLPPELIDMVMDHLNSHRRTLAACSIVCKAWIYPARSRLFADISLNRTNIKKFFESGSAAIPFIRHLRIWCYYNPSFWNKNIPRLAGFKNIRSLSLAEDLPWQDIFPETRLSFQTHFAAIVRLRLTEIYVDSFSELAEVICSFPHLETLVIDGASWNYSDTPSPSLCLSDDLRVLEVHDCEPEDGQLLEWLFSLERTPALHTVYLHESDLVEINRFLQALGISLEVLLCGTYFYDVDRPVNLSYNTCLQVLHIKLYKPNGAVNTRQRVTQWVTRVLSQIVSEHMNRVVFEVDDDLHDILEWTKVDSILALSQFSRLKNVDINAIDLCIENTWEKLDLFDWLISRLPQCHARGILSIHLAEWKSTYL